MMLDPGLQEILQNAKGARQTQRATRAAAESGLRHEPLQDATLERRVSALETSVASIDKTLTVMAEQLKHVATREDLAALSAKIDGKASAADLAVLSGKVDTKASAADLAVIAGKLDTKASATDLAELKGRVARIPTVPVLVSILVLISLLFATASWTVRHLPETWSRALQ